MYNQQKVFNPFKNVITIFTDALDKIKILYERKERRSWEKVKLHRI